MFVLTKVNIDPCPAPRMTQRDRWAKRPAVNRYMAFRNELFDKYQQHLPIPCTIIFTIPMPGGWSAKKKAAMFSTPHLQRPDIDNLQKAVFDALLKEDSHVWAVTASKVWGYTGSIEIGGEFAT